MFCYNREQNRNFLSSHSALFPLRLSTFWQSTVRHVHLKDHKGSFASKAIFTVMGVFGNTRVCRSSGGNK